MLPRKSDSDMCRDGASTAKLRSQHPVDEPGRVLGVSDLDHIADAQRLSSNKGRLLAMKERWRWRKLRKSGSQIGRQDKSRASFGPGMVGFLRLCVYGTAQKCHTQRAKRRAAAQFSYGIWLIRGEVTRLLRVRRSAPSRSRGPRGRAPRRSCRAKSAPLR